VLVVMKNRNFHAFLEPRLDLETFRPLYVLEINTAERRLKGGHRLNHTVDGVGGDLDVEDIDAGEFLEKNRLAFHDRLGRKRTYVAQSEHSRAITDHRDQIGAGRKGGCFRRVVGDLKAGSRNSWRIGERQVALIGKRLARLYLQLPGLRETMIS